MTATNTSSRRRLAPAGFLTNVSMGWKMSLMALALFLGMLGVTLSAYLGLQSLRYQLSNIYDFMLVPIVAINHADAALAEAQYHLAQSFNEEINAQIRTEGMEHILDDTATAQEIIARYDTEWVTTVSPEFTQSLRHAGKLALQEQEIAALANFHKYFDAYQTSLDQYLASFETGAPDATLGSLVTENLHSARSYLQELIDINNEYADFSNDLAQEAFRNALLSGSIVLAVAVAIGVLISFLITTSITGRLGNLTRGAEAMQKGGLETDVEVGGRDEVGILGNAFNNMAKQLQELIATLEQRVADRTRALTTVAEIGTATSTILELEKLLHEIVELSKERFNLYHSHIYLLDEAGENLVLTAGAGEAGRIMAAEGHSIPLAREQSLVARAAREGKGVIVNDVTQSPDFLPNPLLPNTRSELAVPMMVGNRVIGVFDVQSDMVERFTDADIAVQTTLASQAAAAIENARLYTQAEITRQETQLLVDYAGEAIMILDLTTGLFKEPNANAEKIYGLPREELVKVGPAQMSPPRQPDGRDSAEKAMEMIGIAMEKGIHIFEWDHINGQGDLVPCEVRLVRLPGEHPRLRVSVLDITERKRLEELTVQRARQQEAINLITQKIQSAATIESALQIAARELGHALGRKPTMVALDPATLTGKE